MVQEEQQELSYPDSAIYVNYVATSAYAQHGGTMEGSNEPKENGLICPPGMDIEIF